MEELQTLKRPVTLLNDFPRFMGNPRQQVIWNAQQRDEYIQKYYRRFPLYISVYKFLYIEPETGEPDRQSVWIDKVFLDFDEDDWLKDVMKVHWWCEEHNIVHRCHFSGRGGHAFLFVDPVIKHKAKAVRNFQLWLKQDLKLNLDAKGCSSTSRIFRYPNSYHFKARRYCVPIPGKILNDNLTMDMLIELSEKQQFRVNPWVGEKVLSLKPWDQAELLYEEKMPAEFNTTSIDESVRIEYPEFPPCVQSWLSTPDLIDEGKFLLVLYLKDQNVLDDMFDAQAIVSILKKSLCPAEFDHYFGNGRGVHKRRHRGHHGIKFRGVMENDYFMPACNTIRLKGFCPGNCGRSHPIYD